MRDRKPLDYETPTSPELRTRPPMRWYEWVFPGLLLSASAYVIFAVLAC